MTTYKEMRRILLLVCVFVFSCNPERKLQRAETTLSSHPERAAQYCADRYPVKEKIVYRDSIVLDTLYELSESVIDTLYQNDTCYITTTSPGKIINKTITKYKEVQVENTARIQEKEKLYQDCEKQYHELYTKLELTEAEKKGWRSKFWWVLFVAIGAVIGYLTKQPWWSTLVKQLQKLTTKK